LQEKYQEALDKSGVSLDEIVKGIKNLSETAKDESIRFDAYELLLNIYEMANCDCEEDEYWEEEEYEDDSSEEPADEADKK